MGLELKKCDITNIEYLYSKGRTTKAICLLHGYGASMQDLAPLANELDPHNDYNWYFLNGVLSVPLGFMMEGRAWFPIDMVELQRAIEAGDFRSFRDYDKPEFEIAANKCEEFLKHHLSSYSKKVLGGFSQGAMISTHLSMKNSEFFDGLICLSGTLIAQKKLIEYLEKSRKIPFFQSHGKSDPVLSYNQAKELFELLKLGGHQGEFVSFQGAHEIPMEVVNKTKIFLASI